MSAITRTFLLFACLVIFPWQIAHAHGDEDHGDEATATTMPIAQARTFAQTQDIELVAVAKGHGLTIWLDDWETNTPVNDAKLSVTYNGETKSAQSTGAIYEVDFAGIDSPGEHLLDFIVVHNGSTQALSATLTVSASPEEATDLASWLWAILALVIASAVIALLWRRKRMAFALFMAGMIGASLFLPQQSVAHGDEEHEAEATTIVTGDQAAVQNDGSVFAPKAFQHAIELRTALTAQGRAASDTVYSGRVIIDPAKGGVVQSLNGGRLVAPSGGLPRIGDFVRAGQTLALIKPAIDAASSADIAQSLAALERDIAAARSEARRLERLKGVVPDARIQQAQIRLSGLLAERNALSAARDTREVLRAPVSGVISQIAVQRGAVIAPQTNIFTIANRNAFLVELDVFDGTLPPEGTIASAQTSSGDPFSIRLLGGGLGGPGGVTSAIFAPVDQPSALRDGIPVTVSLTTGQPVDGVIIPSSALIKDTNAVDTVIIKTAPERFEKRVVRAVPAGTKSLAILAGIEPGQRVVTDSASLLAQIR